MKEISYFTETGKQHIKEGIENQDAFAFKMQGNYVCAVIADGAGSKTQAKLGATMLSQTLADYIAENAESFYFKMEKKEIQEDIEQKAISILEETAESIGCIRKDLGSTFVIALINRSKEAPGVLTIHLGDGAIILGFTLKDGINSGKGMKSVLSFPKNGRTSHETFLTSMPNFSQYIDVYKREISSNFIDTEVWLMTDGVYWADTFSDNWGLTKPTVRETVEQIQDVEHRDDATYICIPIN